MKQILVVLAALLSSVVFVYVAVNSSAPWAVISLYWCMVAIKNWTDVRKGKK